MTSLPPELRARVLASTQAEPALAPNALVTRRAIAALVPAALIGIVSATMHRHDVDPFNQTSVTVIAVTAAIAALWLLGIGLSRGRAMVGAAPWVLAVAALEAGVVVATMTRIFSNFPGVRSVTFESASAAIAGGAGCAVLATVVGAITLVPLFYARRPILAVRPRFVGACLGAASGAIGFLAVHLHCSAVDPAHALVTHFLPMVLLAGVGALVGPKALRALASFGAGAPGPFRND